MYSLKDSYFCFDYRLKPQLLIHKSGFNSDFAPKLFADIRALIFLTSLTKRL